MTTPPPPPPKEEDYKIPSPEYYEKNVPGYTPYGPPKEKDDPVWDILKIVMGIHFIDFLLDMFLGRKSSGEKPACCGCGCIISAFLMLAILDMVRSV